MALYIASLDKWKRASGGHGLAEFYVYADTNRELERFRGQMMILKAIAINKASQLWFMPIPAFVASSVYAAGVKMTDLNHFDALRVYKESLTDNQTKFAF